jgi:micrococcal nuclease
VRPIVVVLLAAALALLGARVDFGADDEAGFPREARVVRVVDGDTIKVAAGGRRDVVRYIGIDTPESVKPNTPVQCFAKAASAANRRLVDGQAVRLVPGAEQRDRYGRLLAYVYRVHDGVFVNARLVRDGYARTLAISPNTRFATRFSVLQNLAKSEGRGLWARC